MDWIITNIPFFAAILAIVILEIIAMKKEGGFVKQICGIIAAFFAAVLVVLIAFAVRKYLDEARIVFVVTCLLILLMLIIAGIVGTALKGLKFIASLPVIRLVDKFLAFFFVIGEVVVLIWAVYCLVMVLDAGAIETSINNCVANNPVMRFLYDHNPLYGLFAKFSDAIHKADIFGKLGM